MEDEKKALLDVFGELSSSSDELDTCLSSPINPNPNPNWAPIQSIHGLWLCSHFLSPLLRSSLLSAIQCEGWFTEESHNQAMRFGDLPSWAVKLSNHIYEAVCKETDTGNSTCDDKDCIMPSHLLQRDPLFDQLIVNVYQPGEGICAHVDLMRFEDGIAIVSLESPCVMHFSPVESNEQQDVPPTTKIPVYLTPGSLVIMWGDARYKWKHEINRKPGFQVWQEQEIEQDRRTSITLRKLCISE
ncbi:hypothetical protein vseg_003789 [Gypsophila vaccaria]